MDGKSPWRRGGAEERGGREGGEEVRGIYEGERMVRKRERIRNVEHETKKSGQGSGGGRSSRAWLAD